MAAPITLGMMSTFLFQIVDTYFVGKLGSAELAALAFSSTAYMMTVSVFIGLSVGVSSVVAKTVGSGNREQAKSLITISLIMVLLLSVVLCFGARAAIRPMFAALGADGNVLPLIQIYMGILFLSLPFLTVGIVGSGAVRAIGVTKVSEIAFAISGLINLVLDYLLIFGIGPFPELGLAGAAWATALSFLFLFLAMTYILLRHDLIALRIARDAFGGLLDILKFSVSTVSMQVLIPATGMFTTFLLAGYGSEAVAAFGIANRIETLALVGIFAVSMSITPFIAQNFGAERHDRIDQAIIFAGKSSFYLGLVLFVGLAIFGPTIARIFSDDPQVVRFVGLYFKVVAAAYGFQGIVNMTVAIFNGMQMPRTSLKLMAIRTFLIVFPLLYIGSLLGLMWVLIGLALGNVLAALYAARLMRQAERRWDCPIANDKPWTEIRNDVNRLLGKRVI